MQDESLKSTGQTSPDGMTCEPSRQKVCRCNKSDCKECNKRFQEAAMEAMLLDEFEEEMRRLR